MRIPSVSTAAEQEAERRPEGADYAYVIGFKDGAEWAWENPPDHIRELLEAAEAYRRAWMENMGGPTVGGRRAKAIERLLAAAAALPGGTDVGSG